MTESETLEVAASGVIEVKGEYQIAPETAYLCLYYSPKKRKFIKGRFLDDLRTRHHHHGVVLYALYPGRYVKFELAIWGAQVPPCTFILSIVDVTASGEKVAAQVKVRGCREFVERLGIAQLVDFYNAKPTTFHRRPRIDFNRVYSEEENAKLLAFIMKHKWEEITEDGCAPQLCSVL
jgi:hypothetical protein